MTEKMTEWEEIADKLEYAKNNNLNFKPSIDCVEHHLTYLRNGHEPIHVEKTRCVLKNCFERVILENEKEKTDFYRFLQGRDFKKNENVIVGTTLSNEVKIKTENTCLSEMYKKVIFE